MVPKGCIYDYSLMGKKVFGHVVRDIREAAGISQEELAHRASIHRTHISQIERGIKVPTITTLAKLAKALGTTPSKIMRLTENGH